MNENLKQPAPLMELRGITKRFPGVTALSDVSLSIHTGEVLALVGENGAGKSTLIKVMTGFHQMDEGEILIDGAATTFTHPNQAIDAGIACIYQELSIVPDIDVAKKPVPWKLAEEGRVSGQPDYVPEGKGDFKPNSSGRGSPCEGIEPVYCPAADAGDRQGVDPKCPDHHYG